ncbi:MAG: TRAP transporter small permease [Deltaproteobacteria bacterium]|nr:TRAP transporter small permease [Deltaproteobacteria bacterium]
MYSLSTIESAIARWTRVVAVIGLVGLVVMSLTIVLQVLARWLLNYSLLGVYDFSSLAIRISIASCFPLVFAERRNIGVRLIGKINPRVGKVFDAFSNLVALGVFIVMFWQLLEYINNLIATKESTWTVNIPLAPWVAVATGLIVLCIPIQAFYFFIDIKSAITWNRDQDQDAPAGTEKAAERRDLL